jgi:GT2 family glycosyltransferase
LVHPDVSTQSAAHHHIRPAPIYRSHVETIALNKGLHPQSLERLCTAALSAGDAEAAFMLADRRCRVLPHAEAHHFVLRAEALMRLGDRDGATLDIAAALALSPEDVQANRRMLSWGDSAQKEAAARALIASDDDAAVLVASLAVVHDTGSSAVAAMRTTDETISGWAAWNGRTAPVLTISDGHAVSSLMLVADPAHPLADSSFDHVAGFHLQRTPSAAGHTVRLLLSQAEFFRARAGANERASVHRIDHSQPQPRIDGEVTVIVPIYRDLQATRECLTSLETEIDGWSKRHAILVDDATPEPGLERYLAGFVGRPGFTLLKNETNLGFVGSINRALAHVGSGDVVLLNADTILPPDCFARMTSIARADPTIGTITPLSNNGEFTSFPIPFESNPLPAAARIAEIDQVAARLNEGKVIDLPNGIGFCLYITRHCLDSVGALSHAYQRGYLEDVDYCLRARERGFRNVCAASIFVGHHGSRSFGKDKRALVVRNVAVASARFPDYRQECALFMAMDPLRPARAALERRLTDESYDHLLVCGSRLLEAVAEERASLLRKQRKRAIILRVEHGQLHLCGADGKAPQSLMFQASSSGVLDLAGYLSALNLRAIEIVEPGAVSDPLLQALKGLDRPMVLLTADAGLVCPRGTLIQADGTVCPTLGTDKVCPPCTSRHGGKPWRKRWQSIGVGDVGALDERGRGFAAFLSAEGRVLRKGRARTQFVKAGDPGKERLGLVVQGSTIDEFRLIQHFLREALRCLPDQTFVVIGQTADDLALMASGNVFVSGCVESASYRTTLRQYGITRLFMTLRRPLYGHPAARAAMQSGLPIAYFDWSFGHAGARRDDLAIDPRCNSADLVARLHDWMEASA